MNSDDARPKKKVVFLGTPSIAAQSLEKLCAHAAQAGTWEICSVVTQPAQMQGRGSKRALTSSPVALAAEASGIPVLAPERAKDEAFLEKLEALEPDLCVTAAYGQWLPKRFLTCPRLGTLNIHPSLLPKWRGASPIQRSLEAGDGETGVTILWTVAKMDAGPIAAQVTRPLDGDEKAPELLAEMFSEGTDLLANLLPDVFSGVCTPESSQVQDEDGVVHADKITVDEAQVCFSISSAAVVHNRVRGFAGWPGVWSWFRVGEGEPGRYKLITTRIADPMEIPESSRGTREVAVVKGRLLVPCADGSALELLEIQAPGKRALDARAFSNGLRGASMYWEPPTEGGL